MRPPSNWLMMPTPLKLKKQLTTSLTSTQTTLASLTKELEGTTATLGSERTSTQKLIISLQGQLNSSTTTLAHREEANAAQCNESADLKKEIAALSRKVEKLVGDKEELEVSLKDLSLDRERTDGGDGGDGLTTVISGLTHCYRYLCCRTNRRSVTASSGFTAETLTSITKELAAECNKSGDRKKEIADFRMMVEKLKEELEVTLKNLALDKDGLEEVKVDTVDAHTKVERADGGAILCIGNPGSGKSTILNSTIGHIKFESGFSWGSGKTIKMEEHESNGTLYIDTPGLADPKYREVSANAIIQALRKEMKMKILFVVTLEGGHVRQQDQVTTRLVLEAIKDEIGENDYGIIVNKVPVSEAVNAKSLIKEELFFHKSDTNIPVSDRIFLLLEDMTKTEEDNVLLHLPQDYNDFLQNVPSIHIPSVNVLDIDWNKYERLQNEINRAIDECNKLEIESNELSGKKLKQLKTKG